VEKSSTKTENACSPHRSELSLIQASPCPQAMMPHLQVYETAVTSGWRIASPKASRSLPLLCFEAPVGVKTESSSMTERHQSLLAENAWSKLKDLESPARLTPPKTVIRPKQGPRTCFTGVKATKKSV